MGLSASAFGIPTLALPDFTNSGNALVENALRNQASGSTGFSILDFALGQGDGVTTQLYGNFLDSAATGSGGIFASILGSPAAAPNPLALSAQPTLDPASLFAGSGPFQINSPSFLSRLLGVPYAPSIYNPAPLAFDPGLLQALDPLLQPQAAPAPVVEEAPQFTINEEPQQPVIRRRRRNRAPIITVDNGNNNINNNNNNNVIFVKLDPPQNNNQAVINPNPDDAQKQAVEDKLRALIENGANNNNANADADKTTTVTKPVITVVDDATGKVISSSEDPKPVVDKTPEVVSKEDPKTTNTTTTDTPEAATKEDTPPQKQPTLIDTDSNPSEDTLSDIIARALENRSVARLVENRLAKTGNLADKDTADKIATEPDQTDQTDNTDQTDKTSKTDSVRTRVSGRPELSTITDALNKSPNVTVKANGDIEVQLPTGNNTTITDAKSITQKGSDNTVTIGTGAKPTASGSDKGKSSDTGSTGKAAADTKSSSNAAKPAAPTITIT